MPPKRVMGVEIREKRDDATPTSISPSGLLGWAARHGRSWNPIGVATLIILVGAATLIAAEYTNLGQALVAAWKANTEATKANTAEMANLRRERAEDRALLERIDKQLKVSGAADATTRIVELERKMRIVGIALNEFNGAPLNDSFPVAQKGDFTPPPEAPKPLFPLFKTKQQWALKPE